MHIDICVATYKRPELLKRLLDSLQCQALPAGVTASIIVVDNDPACTGRLIAERAANGIMPVRYYTQPQKNIALTRNAGVAHSTGELLAFIDDDEQADAGWLKNLYNTLIQYEADVVFGPVIGELPPGAPNWIAEGRFFDRERYQTGTKPPIRGTGNVLMRASVISDRVSPFNPKYGLSGGEDAEFFKKLRDQNAKFVWCDEAIAREAVVPNRLTSGWLIRRAFRGGQVFAEIFIGRQNALGFLRWFFYRASLAVVALLGGVLSWPFKKAWGIKCFQKMASNVGQLSTLLQYRYQEYGEK